MRLRITRLVLAAGLAFAPICAATADEVIRFGIAEEPNPPFTVKDTTGAWTGWEVDIRDAICAKLNVTCEWVDTPWDELLGDLKAKRFDVVWSSLPITEDGRKSIAFTDRYYALPTAVAGLKASASIVTPEALRGKTIGVLATTAPLGYANRHFKGYVREIKVYQNQDDANQDLASGRIDAELGDALTLSSFLATEQGRQCCMLLGTVASDPKILGEGFAAGLRKADTDLRDRINTALKAVRQSGEYDAITRRYFAFDVYGP
jgi:polar amino acid transport system substrate-binding protein